MSEVEVGVFPYVDFTGTDTPGAMFAPLSSYAEEVRADAPVAYWPMNDPGMVQPEDSGGPELVLTGATPGVTGAWPALGDAVSFDGVDDYGRVSAVNLSDTDKTTVECCLKWDAYANNDDLALEFGETNAWGGFWINPNDSTGPYFTAALPPGAGGDAGGYHAESMPRSKFSADVWHHLVVAFDRAGVGATQILIYVDGVRQTTATLSGADRINNFPSLPLMVMARSAVGNGAKGLFGGGDMQHLAVYDHLLTPERILAHYQGLDVEPPPPPQALAPLTVQLTDDAGNTVAGTVDVRRRDAEPTAVYAGEDGAEELELPAATTAEGAFLGWVEPGEYEWRATHGSVTLDWSPLNVGVRVPGLYEVAAGYLVSRDLHPETASTAQVSRVLATLIDDLIAAGVLIPPPP